MSRMPVVAVSLAALSLAAPALAADKFGYPDFRPAYPGDWQTSADDPLRFETGVRYWYALGSQEFSVGALSQEASSATHNVEGHFRIDDFSTNSYLKGFGGLSFDLKGSYSSNGGPSQPIENGQIGYVGADFGHLPFGSLDAGFGAFVGYHYWKDSPNTGRDNFTTATSSADISWTPGSPEYSLPFDSEPNNLDIHALRLGLIGRADFGPFDVSAEVAAVPYAQVSGTLGALGTSPGPGPYTGDNAFLSSPVTVTGTGYGAMGEVMVGIKPTENIALRVGGRAWYLQGQTEATYTMATVTGPLDLDADPDLETPPSLTNQGFIMTQDNPFSLFRYGLLAEVSIVF